MTDEPACVRYVDEAAAPGGDGRSWESALRGADELEESLAEDGISPDSCLMRQRVEGTVLEHVVNLPSTANPPSGRFGGVPWSRGPGSAAASFESVGGEMSAAAEAGEPIATLDMAAKGEESKPLSYQAATFLKAIGGTETEDPYLWLDQLGLTVRDWRIQNTDGNLEVKTGIDSGSYTTVLRTAAATVGTSTDYFVGIGKSLTTPKANLHVAGKATAYDSVTKKPTGGVLQITDTFIPHAQTT